MPLGQCSAVKDKSASSGKGRFNVMHDNPDNSGATSLQIFQMCLIKESRTTRYHA